MKVGVAPQRQMDALTRTGGRRRARPTPGCRSNAVRNWREGASVSVSERERETTVCGQKYVDNTANMTLILCRFDEGGFAFHGEFSK